MDVVHRSKWRSSRLLIIAWHGISIHDEHRWSPGFYMSPGQFKKRLQIIESSKCNVLPLSEGISRLRSNTLPERSVCLTFDDGFADFSLRALPILKSFGFPVTVYMATKYLGYSLPIFAVAAAYLSWKKRGSSLGNWTYAGISLDLDLRTEKHRNQVVKQLIEYADREQLSLEKRDELLSAYAERIAADEQPLRESRMLQIMNPSELRSAVASGVDIQLHSHSHTAPKHRDDFQHDLTLNLNSIQDATGLRPTEFCYPSGVHFKEYVNWLREAGIQSSVTCNRGLASASDDPLLLPRYSDGCGRSDAEFEGWLSGLSSLITDTHLLRKPVFSDWLTLPRQRWQQP